MNSKGNIEQNICDVEYKMGKREVKKAVVAHKSGKDGVKMADVPRLKSDCASLRYNDIPNR